MVGQRPETGLRYPVNDTALRHGAGVTVETTVGREAYARFPEPTVGPYRDGLPG
jgi:hypothetical protein